MSIEPFKISVPDSALLELKQRLADARWPDSVRDSGWTYGVDLDYMRVLHDYWLHHFDWRQQETCWNRLSHYRFLSDGMRVHFIHVRGKGPSPLPIILSHGWPGSFLEMLDLIPHLVDPEAFGGSRRESFDVVIPSLPGYGFSDRPSRAGLNTFAIADIWVKLMRELGYGRFIAQGGDFGSNVSTVLAWKYPEHVMGLHLNYIPGSYRPYVDPAVSPMTEEERQFELDEARWFEEKGAYCSLQIAQPQTVAFALNDSPIGLAAWIVDKFRAWSDCDGNIEQRFTKDDLLANVTLYWLTETAGSSMRLYFESRKAPLHFAKGERISVPTAVARFPKEEPFPPRPWVERVYDVTRWTTMPKGGHFAAWEEPELLAQDIREFSRQFRPAS